MTSGKHCYLRRPVASGKGEVTDIIEPVGTYLRQLIASGKETRRFSAALRAYGSPLRVPPA